MSMTPDPANEALERALDQALVRSLPPPALPANFRARLRASLARSATTDHARLRAALEREHAEQMAELDQGYVRMRQRTLGGLIGGAFAAGLLLTFALPWITAHFGRDAVYALPAIGAAIGLGLSARTWVQRTPLARWLP